MGNVVLHHKKGPEADAKKLTKKISRQLSDAWANEQAVVKLMLLGAGESGKSTFMKQMKIHFQGGFSESERREYTRYVHANCIEFIQRLVKSTDVVGATITPALQSTATQILGLSPYQSRVLNSESKAMITQLLADSAIKATLDLRHKFDVPESAIRFFGDLDRLADALYIPTDQDILLCRNRTTGVVSVSFNIDHVPYRLVDVGGQRSERRKWFQCFDNVHAILFVMSLNEFDSPLFEDPTTNSMSEAFHLFEEICNGPNLESTPMVVMMNKSDLLRHRIEHVNPADTFPDYTGGHNFDAFVKYVTKRLKLLNRHPTRNVFYHLTCATDSTMTRVLFDRIREHVFNGNLKEAEFAI